MKVLIGCEYSDTEGAAFRALGHDVVTCDLLPGESTDPNAVHYQGDVRDLLGEPFELAIFHPTCTLLTRAGARWLYDPRPSYDDKLFGFDRWKAMIPAATFVRELLNCPIPCVAVENPVPHTYAVQIIGRKQDQVLQPYDFGHPERKGIGLWLRGLPPLMPTEDVKAHMLTLPKKDQSRIHYASPAADRWKTRSTSFPGVARAMAEQWTAFVAGEMRAA